MSNCTICRRTTDTGLHACPRHATELRLWLAELPGQARLLSQFLTPTSAPATGRLGGTGRATAPIPVDLRVLTLLGPGHPDANHPDDDGTVPIRAFLGGWAGYIAYTHPAVTRDPHGTTHIHPCEQAWPREGETITGWCTWLNRYLPYALTQPWIGDLHRQLGDLNARILDLTHATPHTHDRAAPCPQCGTFDLVAIDGQADILCKTCGHQLDPQAYEQYAAAYLHSHQTATDTAA
ncbi:hypothetical protein ACH4C6_07550 [Streptomyces sp. NPDC017943]|uniref:hypothetical protein n=1 Tax=Streptomyces sp. NPDC017943 TaxID=3365019 RepID=UPI0037A8386D